MRTLMIAALVLVFATPMAYARKWTDSTGKFSIQGELLEVKDGKARIEKKEGGVTSIPVAKLSKLDQKFIEKQNLATDDDGGDSKSRAKEAFIAAIKEVYAKKNPQLLLKHVYESKKCPPMMLTMMAGEFAKNINKKLKDVKITDETDGVPGMDFPLPIAGKLEITYEEDGKGETKATPVPLGFKNGAYFFMIPKQLMQGMK